MVVVDASMPENAYIRRSEVTGFTAARVPPGRESSETPSVNCGNLRVFGDGESRSVMSFTPGSSLVAGASTTPDTCPRIGGGRLVGNHMLVALLSSAEPVVTDQLRVAASLARTTGASLRVVNPIASPERPVKVYRGGLSSEDERELIEWALPQGTRSVSQTIPGLLSTRGVVTDIVRTVEANDIDTLVVPSDSNTGWLRPRLADRIALRARCDVITVNGRRGFEHVPSILLAVAGGPHSGLATDLAGVMAADCDAWIDVLHVVEEDEEKEEETEDAKECRERVRTRAEAYVEAAYQRIGRHETTTTWVLEAQDVASAIIEQSAYYALTVVGAPTKGRLRRFISGSTNRSIRNNARSVVLSARHDQ